MKEVYDVIVIGAGPAGGQCARNLAKKGINVLLVEKFNSFYDNNFSSAGMSMQGFQEFDLPDDVIGQYWKNLSIQTSNELSIWKGDENKGVVLDFAKLRQFLADDCIKNGGEVLMGFSYVAKVVSNNQVIAQFYSKKEDKKISLKAKLLVDATGPARKVIYNSLEEQPKMEKSAGVEYLIKVNDQVYNRFKEDLFFFLGNKWCYKGYSWIFPMSDNVLKVGTAKMLDNDKTKQTESLKQITERIIKDYMNSENHELIDVHGGVVRSTRKITEAFYQDNVVAIGDSISAINPLGGEGIRYALRSADDVAIHIENFIKKGKNTFAVFRKKWRKKYLFTWRLCLFLAETVYKEYPDEKLDARIKKYGSLIDIDQLINIVFEFKFNKIFRRIFSFLSSRIKAKFK